MATIDLVLESSTKRSLLRIVANPPHAFLIAGPMGIGKSAVADWLITQFDVGPYILVIEPEKAKASIGVEAVRQLEHFLSLRIASDKLVSRVVRIDNAHLLTIEAQNAMLKTLEEPPAGTVILLTSSEQEALLPTVRSRLQVIEIAKPKADDLMQALPKGQDKSKIMALSGGLPGLAFALAVQDQDHPLVRAAGSARELLQASTFERVARVDVLSKNKDDTRNLLYILMQMAHAALLTGRGTERWQQVLAATYDAEADIRNGAQAKLALTKLMLAL